ncbi:MAG: response regulator [Saprospiraceae bacterium]|nr:response regulator [Saprospiraceae bacterium]
MNPADNPSTFVNTLPEKNIFSDSVFHMFQGKKVLVVEDNPADAELILLAFKIHSPDTELKVFQTGPDLLYFLKSAPSEYYALILMDLNMPVMNGRELLSRLNKHDEWKEIPKVVFSSSKQREDVRDCYELGAKAYVAKPFDLQEFEKAIASIASFWFRVQPNYFYNPAL